MSQFFAVMLRQRLYPKLPPINRRHACTRIAATTRQGRMMAYNNLTTVTQLRQAMR